MLHVHRSNRTEALVTALADVLGQPADPFAQDIVVVHSRGLERWLSMQLADTIGVCANVRFPFPDELVAELIGTALDDIDLTAWTADRLTWAVHAALVDLEDDPRLQLVHDWLHTAHADPADYLPRRRISLATRLAALLLRYATYRPHLVAHWLPTSSDWQQVLWCAVRDRLGRADLASAADRLDLAIADADLSALTGRICLFSVSTLSPLHARLLAMLARRIDVHLFVLCPSKALAHRVDAETFEGDAMPRRSALSIPLAHPLLRSMGELARDFLVALAVADDRASVHDHFVDPGDDAALHMIQAGILADRVETDLPLLPTDDSVRVHACHGPTRQVQVLRDVLLDRFARDPSLQPRDVLVMCPDIEAYAPLVEAVFSDTDAGALDPIPYRIADRGARAANPAAAALMAALELLDGRMERTAVLDLLSMHAVRARFGLEPGDIDVVTGQVSDAEARWGADEAHRVAEGLPATDTYTWRYAVDRALIGQAVLDRALVFDVAPGADLEGKQGRALLGAWIDFVEILLAHRTLLDGLHPIDVWRDRVVALVHDLVGPDGWEVQAVRDGLQTLVDEAAAASDLTPIDRDALITLLDGRFTVSEPGRGYLAGGVTVCELVPMRSIPFRVVCLLGMDDQAFPRLGTRPAFDRIASHPRPGDRTPRIDDRGLFLESLLSARDALEILYTGRGVRDDRTRAPAVPVDELLDLLDRSFVTGRREPSGEPLRPSAAVVLTHTLQPFRPGPLGTFDVQRVQEHADWLAGRASPTRPVGFLPDPLDPVAVTTLSIRDLIRFVQHPTKWFCQRRLGVYLPDDDEEDDAQPRDREPLGPPDNLQRWALLDEGIRTRIEGGDLAAMKQTWRRAGRLAIGTPGDVVYDALHAEIVQLSDAWLALKTGPTATVDVTLDLAGIVLSGRVRDVVDGARVAWRAGTVRDKYKLQLWVQHLCLAALGNSGTSKMVGRYGSFELKPVTPDAARARLSWLLELYRTGQRVPLLFFPTCAWKWFDGKSWNYKWGKYEEPGPYGRWVLGDHDPYASPAVPGVAMLDGHDPHDLATGIYARMTGVR